MSWLSERPRDFSVIPNADCAWVNTQPPPIHLKTVRDYGLKNWKNSFRRTVLTHLSVRRVHVYGTGSRFAHRAMLCVRLYRVGCSRVSLRVCVCELAGVSSWVGGHVGGSNSLSYLFECRAMSKPMGFCLHGVAVPKLRAGQTSANFQGPTAIVWPAQISKIFEGNLKMRKLILYFNCDNSKKCVHMSAQYPTKHLNQLQTPYRSRMTLSPGVWIVSYNRFHFLIVSCRYEW